MATINIGELATSTLRNRTGELADNVTNHNATFQRLNSKGNVQTADGGRDIVQELMYAENSTVTWYSGYETIPVIASEIMDAAVFSWKQLAGNVVISGLEGEVQNSGKERVINLLSARIRNLEISLRNAAATAVYDDGTSHSGKCFGGLALLVQTDPTAASSPGGISQATYTWWRNQTSGDVTSLSASNITGEMNSLWLSCTRGTDKPDLIPCDANTYTFYEESLQPLQRFASPTMADAGFTSIKYKSADVVYDDQCPANRMFFLNTDYIFLRPHVNRQFVTLDQRNATNQDATVIPVVYAGNMTVSNRSLQGILWT
jgi:hypothetical protein